MSARVPVLHVITRLDPGGSAENALATVRGLPPERFESWLAYGGARAPDGALPAIPIPALAREVSPRRDARALGDLLAAIRRLRPRILHTHTSKAGALGRMAGRIARVPAMVHTPHGHILYGYHGEIARRAFLAVERLLARATDRLVALTRREADEWMGAGVGGPRQWTVIPSGVDLARFRAVRPDPEAKRRFGFDPGDPVVGAVGRLDPVKGHATLLFAWPTVLASMPRARLVLVGDGSERGRLESAAANLGLREWVAFAGERADVEACLAAFDLFAFPSRNEGMGRALVEALAAGVPAVASRAGGIPDVLPEGRAGLLVPPDDPEAWGAAILRILGDGAERARMAEAAREAIDDRYSTGFMVSSLANLYDEVLAEKGLGDPR